MSTLVLAEASGASWEIRFEPHEVWFAPPGATGEAAFSLSHRAFARSVTITRAPRGCRLVLRVPNEVPNEGGKTRHFTYPFILDLPVRAWMRRELDVHIAGALAKRVALGIPVGLFMIATALPWGDTPIAPASLVTGVALVVLTLLARLRPRLWLFLGDAVVWLALAQTNAVGALHGSWLSGALAVMSVYFAYQAFREWRFFRGLSG